MTTEERGLDGSCPYCAGPLLKESWVLRCPQAHRFRVSFRPTSAAVEGGAVTPAGAGHGSSDEGSTREASAGSASGGDASSDGAVPGPGAFPVSGVVPGAGAVPGPGAFAGGTLVLRVVSHPERSEIGRVYVYTVAPSPAADPPAAGGDGR